MKRVPRNVGREYGRRSAKKEGVGWGWIALATVGGVSVLGAVATAISGGFGSGKTNSADTWKDGVSATVRGYEVLPGCGGFKIFDEARALIYAEGRGALPSVEPYEDGGHIAFVAQAAARLGLGDQSTCDPAKIPPESLGFAYRIARAYLKGAVSTGKIPAETATAGLDIGRAQLLFQGVPAELLPEGLPA